MKQLKQILSALLILPFLIFSAACSNTTADFPDDTSSSQALPPITDLQTNSQAISTSEKEILMPEILISSNDDPNFPLNLELDIDKSSIEYVKLKEPLYGSEYALDADKLKFRLFVSLKEGYEEYGFFKLTLLDINTLEEVFNSMVDRNDNCWISDLCFEGLNGDNNGTYAYELQLIGDHNDPETSFFYYSGTISLGIGTDNTLVIESFVYIGTMEYTMGWLFNKENNEASTDVSAPAETTYNENTETSTDTSAPTAITYKMTAEDEEVKKIIEGIYDDADNFINHVASPYEYIDYEAMGIENPESGISGRKDEFLFYTDKNDYDSENEIECFSYVPLSIPGISSCKDLKNRMLTCFTEEVTNDWLRIRTTKCELLEKNGKSFLVKLTEGDSIRKDFIELDGKLYAPVGQRMNIFYLDIIKVIERTESKIKFVYPQFAADSSLYTVEGVLEYENGWKFGWYCIVSLDPWEGDFNFSTAAQGVS